MPIDGDEVRKIARLARLDLDESVVSKVEVAGPGFLNFHFSTLKVVQVVGGPLDRGRVVEKGAAHRDAAIRADDLDDPRLLWPVDH